MEWPDEDYRLNETLERVLQKRIAERAKMAAEEAAKAANRETALRMLDMGISIGTAAVATTLTLEEVKQLKRAHLA